MESYHEEIKSIFARNNTIPDESWWNKFDSVIHIFKDNIDRSGPPRNKTMKREIEDLIHSAENLYECINSISTQSLGKIILSGVGSDSEKVSSNYDKVEKIKDVTKELKWISEQAQYALENIPQDKGGREENFLRKQFIENMAQLWERATGQKPSTYYSEAHTDKNGEHRSSLFLMFLRKSLEISGLDYRTQHAQNALSKEAQRVLRSK
jgi:hypothetical protein